MTKNWTSSISMCRTIEQDTSFGKVCIWEESNLYVRCRIATLLRDKVLLKILRAAPNQIIVIGGWITWHWIGLNEHGPAVITSSDYIENYTKGCFVIDKHCGMHGHIKHQTKSCTKVKTQMCMREKWCENNCVFPSQMFLSVIEPPTRMTWATK